MAEVKHEDRAHAKLSASGSKRWMACTPSAELEKQFPDKTSEYAEEGTFAHELSELYLAYQTGQLKKATFTRRLNKKKKEDFFSEEMDQHVQEYVDFVIERFNEVKADDPEASLIIESKLDYSRWAPGGYGTGDILIISETSIEIIDLKFGKGLQVEATDNPQLRLYALGAINEYGMLYDFETVRMTIVQPRLNHISSDEIPVNNLLEWADIEVKPAAEKADIGEGDFVPGEHCQFCKAKAVCRARADKNIELAKVEFSAETLTVEEIGDLLFELEDIKRWAKDVQDYALEQSTKNGVKYPGWKLVQGRSNRKYSDEDKVAQALAGYDEEVIYDKKLRTISNMEKAIGKKTFNELLSDLIIKPEGKPTLAMDSDKRPEIGSTSSAIEDFS